MDGACETCETRKQPHHSFPKESGSRAKQAIELVHTDLLGPAEAESRGGPKYAIVFTDDKTRWRVIYFLKTKDEAAKKLVEYTEHVSTLREGFKVKRLRTDGRGEFMGADFQQACRERGIRVEPSGPYSPQQNGVAERSWRTLTEMTRALLRDAGLSKSFWAEAMSTAVYIVNRPSKATRPTMRSSASAHSSGTCGCLGAGHTCRWRRGASPMTVHVAASSWATTRPTVCDQETGTMKGSVHVRRVAYAGA
jgi:hypothetical protein